LHIRLSAVYSLTPKVSFDVVIKGPLDKVLGLMSNLGYEGVELNIPNPFEVDIDHLRRAVKNHGLEVSAISTGLSYLVYGYSLSSLEGELREKAIEFFKKYIDISDDLGCRKVVIGLARGRCGRTDCKSLRDNLVNSISTLNSYAEGKDSTLLLEPLNRYETDLINNLPEALEIIKAYSNVKLLFDTFHMMLEERNVYDAIDRAGPYIGHVHLADSNRLAPGLGMLDWERIIYRLVRSGYNGFASVEARAEPDIESLLKTSASTLRSLLI